MDILSLNVTALLPLLQTGELTAGTLTATYLARIAALNPHLHAVLEVNPDALDQARALDALPAHARGPLHGLPVLVKDNIDTAAPLHTTAGSALLARHQPKSDAPLVQRLRAAGAVVIGKANLTEWANFMTLGMPNGYSSQGGQTVNPWRDGHDTGGSSSGSGAGVAARLAPIAIGTETSGSILSPSHQHGLIGLKPTVGLIPRTGIIPIAHSQDTAGPMGRTAHDVALLAGVLQGADGHDPACTDAPTLDFTLTPAALQGARIGVIREGYWKHLSDPERAALETAVQTLQAAGAHVTDPAPLATAAELDGWHLEVLVYEFRHDLDAYLHAVQDGPRSLADVIEQGDTDPERLQRYGQTLLQAAQGTRGDLSERAYTLARERDLHLSRDRGLDPLFDPAGPPFDAVLFPRLSGASIGAKAGYPSVNVPVGLVDGVPLGLQLCGPAWSDARLLSLAADLHDRLGGWHPAPDPASPTGSGE
ncbi:amidase family protein [Deinococcus aquiradiocola]|uniref:Amidase n=1 Tax=Deinococcus aquiradiocola TaxID=393059 RepID=A0A917PGH1_9DEIO|nr:amidase family protein [Deinococcus aquiradiocola]GGJ75646.1 amidase [Deinococcus aquiradiocola]